MLLMVVEYAGVGGVRGFSLTLSEGPVMWATAAPQEIGA